MTVAKRWIHIWEKKLHVPSVTISCTCTVKPPNQQLTRSFNCSKGDGRNLALRFNGWTIWMGGSLDPEVDHTKKPINHEYYKTLYLPLRQLSKIIMQNYKLQTDRIVRTKSKLCDRINLGAHCRYTYSISNIFQLQNQDAWYETITWDIQEWDEVITNEIPFMNMSCNAILAQNTLI